jgi:hypothetical protein
VNKTAPKPRHAQRLRREVLAPSCPEDAESYAETDSRRCPQVWTCLFEELTDVERLSRACAPKYKSVKRVEQLRVLFYLFEKKGLRYEFAPVKRR